MISAKPAGIDEPGACRDGWTDRLSLMEEWYQDLVGDGYEVAEAEIDRWIRPHREYLSRLKGKVIDVGGGIGTIGRFLSPECQHVVVDPAGLWNRREWREFGQRFAPERSPTFVEARGEDLPFADGSFDAAVSCCSLNHVDLPEPCIAELARIVRPEGRVLLVLEDMEPTWPDDERQLRVPVVRDGEVVHATELAAAREHCRRSLAELPAEAMKLSAGDPAIETKYEDVSR